MDQYSPPKLFNVLDIVQWFDSQTYQTGETRSLEDDQNVLWDIHSQCLSARGLRRVLICCTVTQTHSLCSVNTGLRRRLSCPHISKHLCIFKRGSLAFWRIPTVTHMHTSPLSTLISLRQASDQAPQTTIRVPFHLQRSSFNRKLVKCPHSTQLGCRSRH